MFLKIYVENMLKKYQNFRVGSWWRVNNEIDVVDYDIKKNFIFGECKWSNKKVGFTFYNQLLEKMKLVEHEKVEKIIIFSKSGFEKNLEEKAQDLNVELVDLNKLFEVLCE